MPRETDVRAREIITIMENEFGNICDRYKEGGAIFSDWKNKVPKRVEIFASVDSLFEYSEFTQYLLRSNSEVTITEVQHGAIQYWYKNSLFKRKISQIADKWHYWEPERRNTITR